jgi:hypothetical protein
MPNVFDQFDEPARDRALRPVASPSSPTRSAPRPNGLPPGYGHLPAAGIAVTGHAAKMIADAMTRARAARLSQLVRSKAPASIEMRQRLPVRPSVDPRLALIARAAQIGAYRAARQQQ